jgi:hypothetical protein
MLNQKEGKIMGKRKKILVASAWVLVFFITTLIAFAQYKVDSKTYRGWNHVKSMVIFDENHPLYNPFGGIHHVYANKEALGTVKQGEGRVFPDGSVLAFVLYEHVEDNGAYLEGKKKIEAFMVKDSKKYKDTAGWGFYAYGANGKSIVSDMKNECFNCHAQVKSRDYVFSQWTQ